MPAPGGRPCERPRASASPRLPLRSLGATRLCSYNRPAERARGAPYERGCSPRPARGRWGALRGIHVPSARGDGTRRPFCPASGTGFAPAERPARCQESQRGAPKPCRREPWPGETEQCVSPAVWSLSSLRVRERGLLRPSRATRLLSSSCYFLLLQWDCLATSITPPRCVTGKILSSILMAFLRFTLPLVDLTTTITTIKASVKTSSPA